MIDIEQVAKGIAEFEFVQPPDYGLAAGALSRRAALLDELEPQALACLCPADLRRIGAEPGDPIRVTTRRGAIELAARADGAIPSGVIFIPFCYAEAAANVLTNPALDPMGKIPEFKFCAARVEKLPKRTKSG